MLEKKQIKTLVLAVYIVFSLGYIGYTQYTNFKINYINKAFASGRQATVAELVTQATNEECKPVTVFSGEDKVELYNADCLQPANPTQEVVGGVVEK